MALLDVSSVLLDPDLTDLFNVRRRMEILDIHGRNTMAEQLFPQVIGVVTATSPSDLDRHENFQAMPRSITVVCQFRLRGEVIGEQPDIVVWRGDNYIVKHIDPYPQFGRGFIQAECTSMDRVDGALDPSAPIRAAFDQVTNSTLLFLR